MSQARRPNPGFANIRAQLPSSPWHKFYAAYEVDPGDPLPFFRRQGLDLAAELPAGRLARVAGEVTRLEFHASGLCLVELGNPTGSLPALFDSSCFNFSELPMNVLDILDGPAGQRPFASAPDPPCFMPFALGPVVELEGAALVRPRRGLPCLLVTAACLRKVFV